MNNLELILRKIDDDGAKASKAVIDNAEAKAEVIISQAKEQAKQQSGEMLQKAELDCARIASAAHGSAEVLIRRDEAKVKSEIISDWIKSAYKAACELKSDEYFSVISRLAYEYAHAGENGEICFGEKDLSALPESFISKLNEKLSEKNAAVSLCKKAYDIKNGFIIVYDMIEENCTFEALLEDKTDEIKDKLFSVLNR